MKKILCWFGIHKPVSLKKDGYIEFGECERCKTKLFKDNHWTVDRNYWTVYKDEEEI